MRDFGKLLEALVTVTACALFVTPVAAAPADVNSLSGGLHWRLVGPFRGGRAVAATGIPGDPTTYYFGSVAGGVWKTSDAGASWIPIFDHETESSIGAIAIAPSNPSVIYVGTGERDLRNDLTFGGGVFKSVDAGKTWINIGLRDTRHIATIIIDPKNPDHVYVAALGHASGPNKERGVYHSLDGGRTWKNVLYVDERTGATDLAMDPHNPQVLFAAMYEARRKAYTMVSGGPGSGLYKSVDGGATWRRLQGHGLPDGLLGRIGVSVSGANSNRVYAMIEAKENAIYSSADGGNSWTIVNREPLWVRPWYQNEIFADPKDENILYVLNVGAFRSTDGGRTFRQLEGVPHSDNHWLWIDPTNTSRMIEANDGGVTVSVDKGATWSLQNNQPTAQFYHVATDNAFNYKIYGSQQDSGTVAISSRTDHGYIGESDWNPVGGGESGYIWPDPRDPQVVYGGDHNGRFTRYNGHTGQIANISPWFGARAHQASDLAHRFQWTAPMQISPHDPNVLYLGGEAVFKTTDNGMSWVQISPDLTRNDKLKQQSTPEPLTSDNSSSEYYDTVFAIAESPVRKDLIWVGSDDGLVHLTRDGGKHWEDITPKDLPEWSRVNIIEPSPWNEGTAYLAADLHFSDDLRPLIFKTIDFGRTWTAIVRGIPATSYVHSVHADPERRGLLYAGTERGIYVSFDDGGQWAPLQFNLPLTPIYDTAVHGNDLVVATHGRAFWVLDNITPLRQADLLSARQPSHLFTPAVAYRVRGGGARENQLIRNSAPNPPAGAVIDYSLGSASPVRLEITDASGNTVYRGSSSNEGSSAARPTGHAGLNRFVWDLKLRGPAEVPGMVIQEARGGGPLVPPGRYSVTLTVAGKAQTAPLVVQADPRVKISQADFDKQYEFAVKLRDRVSEVHNTVNAMRAARSRLNAAEAAHPERAQSIGTLKTSIDALERGLIQVNSVTTWAGLVFPIQLDAQYAELMNVVESADMAPPAQTYTVFDVYEKRREDIQHHWAALQSQITSLGKQ